MHGAGAGSGLATTPANGDCMVFNVALRQLDNSHSTAGFNQWRLCVTSSLTLKSAISTRLRTTRAATTPSHSTGAAYPIVTYGEYSGSASTRLILPLEVSEVTSGNSLTVNYGSPSVSGEILEMGFGSGSTFGGRGPSNLSQRYLKDEQAFVYFGMYFGDGKSFSSAGTETATQGGSATVGHRGGIVPGATTPVVTATATATPTATVTSTRTPTATATATATGTVTASVTLDEHHDCHNDTNRNRDCHEHRDCDSDRHGDSFRIADCDRDGYSDRDSFSHGNFDADADRNCNGDGLNRPIVHLHTHRHAAPPATTSATPTAGRYCDRD